VVVSEAPPQLPRLAVDREFLRKRKVILGDESTVAAHSYRMLRAQILQRVRATRMRAIGIVSATTGEGKTLTAINLALSLAAEPNQAITLVDLDLKRPSVARVLGISPESGLDTWLAGTSPASAVRYELAGFPRLRVVPTLASIPGSSELLAGGRARQLFDELAAGEPAGLSIVDLPPVLLSDDVLTAAALIEGFVLVITEGKTLREDVERVFELLGRNRIMGTVLNGSSASEQRTY
jgi:Mrp family chromosome partitioning ATPase